MSPQYTYEILIVIVMLLSIVFFSGLRFRLSGTNLIGAKLTKKQKAYGLHIIYATTWFLIASSVLLLGAVSFTVYFVLKNYDFTNKNLISLLLVPCVVGLIGFRAIRRSSKTQAKST